MQIKNVATTAALFLALALPFAATTTAHAAALIALPNLTIAPVQGQANHVFDIRNSGGATAGSCWIRLRSSAGQEWQMLLFPLAPGQVFQVYLPTSVIGLDLQVTLDVDCYPNNGVGRVIESSETDNQATTEYLVLRRPS